MDGRIKQRNYILALGGYSIGCKMGITVEAIPAKGA
jgi:hypothetical protein